MNTVYFSIKLHKHNATETITVCKKCFLPLCSPFPFPFPLPLLLFLSLFPFCPLLFPPFPLPLEVGPLIQLGDLGERCKFPQRVRAERGRQTIFGAFWAEKCFW